jgi:hypothetical protein
MTLTPPRIARLLVIALAPRTMRAAIDGDLLRRGVRAHRAIISRTEAHVFRTLAFALACLSLPLPLLAQRVAVGGPNVRVSRERGDVVQVEPTIAANPRNPDRMVAAAIALRDVRSPDWQDHQTILVYASRDGGRSWSHRALPGLPEQWTAGDPWLLWADGDTVVLAGIAGEFITRRGTPIAATRLFRSTDGGWTWSDASYAPFPPNASQDHPVLALARGGSVYVAGSHASRDHVDGVDLARVSLRTMQAESVPSVRPPHRQVNVGGVVAGPGGVPVVSYFTMLPPRPFWSAHLDTLTQTWHESRMSPSILPVGFPPLAVDQSSGRFAGRIYSVWLASEDQADIRVMLVWSDDGGATWSPPVRVHRDTGRIVRVKPAVAVATDGAVGVTWQDLRNTRAPNCSDLYGAISVNGGESFLPEVRISSETACFDESENGVAAHRFNIGGGDYEGVTGAGPGAFQAVWSDSRTGRFQVWTARFEVRRVDRRR